MVAYVLYHRPKPSTLPCSLAVSAIPLLLISSRDAFLAEPVFLHYTGGIRPLLCLFRLLRRTDGFHLRLYSR